MSEFPWGDAGSKAKTKVVQGSTVGTLQLEVSDVRNEVADILFNVVALDANGVEFRRSGPHPPDITRRPGWYEKDVVLDATLRTRVEVSIRNQSGDILRNPADTYVDFGVRTATAGGTGEVRVKDASTAPTVAETLAIVGAVVGVDNNKVATFNLDGRYAQLSGAAFTGDVSVGGGRAMLGVDSSNGNAKLELGSSTAGGTVPYIDFHHGIGAEQDYNARLMNNGNNLLTVGFAGAGTFNVAGTIAQHGVAVSLSDHHHDARYAPAIHAHEYLPLAGGTVAGSTSFTGGLNASGIKSTSNLYYAGDGAYLSLSNTAAQFLTSGSGALQGRFGSLLLSNDYQHAQNVPANGLWVTGGASLAALTTRGLVTVQGGMRFVNGGVVQASRTDGTADPVFWPRWTDNNTYLNYGSGGYFYIRDNAGNNRLTIGPAAVYFNSAIFVPGENGMALKLGGAYEAAYSYMSSSPNLHLDSKASQNIYLNFSSNRPVNVGTIDQSTYKLAVSGDIILHSNGWFRNGTAGQGMYNHGTGHYLYSEGHFWKVRSGSGMGFFDNNANLKGYVYHDHTGFGLLHAGGGWAVQTTTSTVNLYGTVTAVSGSVIAPDFVLA